MSWCSSGGWRPAGTSRAQRRVSDRYAQLTDAPLMHSSHRDAGVVRTAHTRLHSAGPAQGRSLLVGLGQAGMTEQIVNTDHTRQVWIRVRDPEMATRSRSVEVGVEDGRGRLGSEAINSGHGPHGQRLTQSTASTGGRVTSVSVTAAASTGQLTAAAAADHCCAETGPEPEPEPEPGPAAARPRSAPRRRRAGTPQNRLVGPCPVHCTVLARRPAVAGLPLGRGWHCAGPN